MTPGGSTRDDDQGPGAYLKKVNVGPASGADAGYRYWSIALLKMTRAIADWQTIGPELAILAPPRDGDVGDSFRC
jgi:hypothetical protein